MTNSTMQRRLSLIGSVRTKVQGIVNDILGAGPESVEVCSRRTGRSRIITYDQIRNASDDTTTNGCIVRVLAEVLGLYVP